MSTENLILKTANIPFRHSGLDPESRYFSKKTLDYRFRGNDELSGFILIARHISAIVVISLFIIILAGLTTAWGAVGCDLNDPDRDVARLFPESTGFKTKYVSIDKQGGEPMLKRVEARLGDTFHGLFETIDVPYTVYQIYNKKTLIGYIHGVNQKGQYGGIQVFVSLDLEGRIRAFYIQKMTSQHAKAMRSAKFGGQFIGMDLKDFNQYEVLSGKATGRVAAIKNPAPEAEADFRAALRAAKKNLILMDEFVFGVKPPSAPKGAQ